MKKYVLYVMFIVLSCGASDKKAADKPASPKSTRKHDVKKDAESQKSVASQKSPSLSVMDKIKRFGVITGYGYCD